MTTSQTKQTSTVGKCRIYVEQVLKNKKILDTQRRNTPASFANSG